MALNAAVMYVTLLLRLMCIIFLQSYYKLEQFWDIATDTMKRCVYCCYTDDFNYRDFSEIKAFYGEKKRTNNLIIGTRSDSQSMAKLYGMTMSQGISVIWLSSHDLRSVMWLSSHDLR